jgi:mono/diheme cytochrome c family protein
VLVALCALPAIAAEADVEAGSQSVQGMQTAWRTLRQFDCARCHGRDYEGSVGPSLVQSARERSEADFLRLLLDGNVERGMPGYRSVTQVAQAARDIYFYFKARADGLLGPGAPPSN